MKYLYLIAKREKWGGSKEFFNIDKILKNLDYEDWGIGNLKDIFIGMKGIIKVAEDKNSEEYYKKHNSEKLYAGIYATFEVVDIYDDNYIQIKVIDNFYKMGKIIDKENLISILGRSFYEAQGPRYLDEDKFYEIKNLGLSINSISKDKTPEEIKYKEEKFYEGALKTIKVNAYERNTEARKKCIEHYGTSCKVCGFDFEKVYGEIGKGFIHVHHIVPISKINKEYKVDPIKDLIPVCPNCHAMLHSGEKTLTVQELQNIIENNS